MKNDLKEKTNKRKKLGIYIHMPFCVKKCKYCDFLSFENSDEKLKGEYINALLQEIRWQGRRYKKIYDVDTIFIGGGTPSILKGEQIHKVMETVCENFNIELANKKKEVEITIECNPSSITKEKLLAYKMAGINRLSIGVQSLEDDSLASLGRIHSREEFLKNYQLARKMDFRNINLDLMFGIPNMTVEKWEKTLTEAISLKPEHISFYGLQIEEGTEFYGLYKKGVLGEPAKEEERKMYHKGVDMLGKAGYHKYEISNAALKGYECQHNLKYWNMKDYLGFGLGAHSFMNGIRFNNQVSLKKYINDLLRTKDDENAFKEKEKPLEKVEVEELKKCEWIEYVRKNSFQDNVSEFMITGLRKTEGIDFKSFQRMFHQDFWKVYQEEKENIKKWVENNYLEIKDDRMYLTEEGIDISNEILSDFIFLSL